MALSRTHKILVSATVGISQRGLQVLVTLLTMPMVLHALGREQFGIWGAAASLAWMGHVADLGLGSALTTVIARSKAQGRLDECRAWIASALSVTIPLCLIELGLVWLVVPHLTTASTRVPFLIAGSLLAINVPASLVTGIWLSLQKGYCAWGWESVQTILLFGLLLVFTHTGANLNCYIALSCSVALVNIFSFIHLLISYSELRPNWYAIVQSGHRRSLLQLGLPYFVMSMVVCTSGLGDNIIVLARLGADQAGQMAIVQRALMTAVGMLAVASQPLWPAFADAIAHQDKPWLRNHAWRFMIVLTAIALLGSFVLVLLGRPLIHIWLGGTLELPQTVFLAMAVSIVISVLGRIPEQLLNAVGVVWLQVCAGLVNALITLLLKLTLASALGISGILLIGAFVYGMTTLPWYQFWMHRWLRQV
jgi:O-antigen/teichoic acid export membrane protein